MSISRPRSASTTPASPVQRRNRAGGYLWLLGGLSTIGLNAGKHTEDVHLRLVIGACSCLVAVVLLCTARWVPAAATLPLVCLSQVLITVGGVTDPAERLTGTLGFAYLWGAAFVAYYLPWRQAALQVAITLAVYGGALWRSAPTSTAQARWIATATTLVGFTLVIGRLRDELHRLVQALAAEARHDALTNLLNRRGFTEGALRELAHAQRSGQSTAIIAIDVDHFKRLNDEHGHAAGDVVLSGLGEVLIAQCRPHDLSGRLGGEEFALLLPATDLGEALQVAERLRLAVHALPGPRAVTISLGVSSTTEAGAPGALEGLLASADAALYLAKDAGRDRVRAHGSPAGALT